MIRRASFTLGIVATLTASCEGTTGGELVDFQAFAAGPPDAVAGAPYVFDTPRGYRVELTTAKMHVGAIYLNKAVPTSVSSDTSCTLAGIYVAEVPGPVDVDILSPAPTPFTIAGFATTDRARTAEVWLTGGDIDATTDPTVILEIAGTATRGAEVFPFAGSVTIGQNRQQPPSKPSLPGSKPICKQRVVSPIQVDIRPDEGGHLMLRIDPRGFFTNVDFRLLEADASGIFTFRDDGEDPASKNLFSGLRASVGTYLVTWEH